ncbi:Nop13 protein [Starmerella bacillaris]|uniref:Nop13 protein n=1 Tax=Starmerella bacillaris TaxID=1247836 RepID=A0AAV5RP22_STABA|nr:Nop13 protein [Starmerella bacillaris]
MPSKREFEELEVDLTAPKPLNKKQKRLLKKGKIDEPEPEDPNKVTGPKPRSEFAVWIGNLSYDTTTEGIRNFIIENTEKLTTPILTDDILRIKLPPKKGFAYVDLKNAEQVKAVVDLSESRLDNRNLLIKDAASFQGRPENHTLGQKNPPSRILFVGNLPFDVTDQLLQEHFQHCGEITKIRTATFQDTGKCKGFTFVDFKNEDGPTNALKDPKCKRLGGRTLRMEFGEDRSQRRPQHARERAEGQVQGNDHNQSANGGSYAPRESNDSGSNYQTSYNSNNRDFKPREPREFKPRESRDSKYPKERRSKPTPGAALSGAQRAKQSVVPSSGKKVTFD